MKIIFLIRVFRWCKSAMCSRRSLSCPNSNHHLFPASIFEFNFQALCQFKRAPFHEEDLPDLRTSSIQSFLVNCHSSSRKLRNSSIPHSDFCMSSDREWSQRFLLSSILLSCFYPQIEASFVFENSNKFLDFDRKFRLVLFSNGHSHCSVISKRHTNIHWKSKEDVCMFGIQSFWSFHFRSWSKNQNSQFLSDLFVAKF
jgi:hypothetical protein